MERSEIVAAARAWVGTPFVHGAARRAAGCDCLGLIRGLRAELTGTPPLAVRAYPPGWALRGGGDALAAGLADWLPPAGDPAPGQVLLFRLRSHAPASHLGVLAETGAAPRFIHAYDRHGVVESPLAGPWARRIAARFELI